MNPEQYRKVKRVYQEAAEREPTERAAFLSEACAGDEPLRQEIESLLAYQRPAEDFIERPAFAVGARLLAGDGDEAVPGRSIGPYRIVREIGRGGMGAVYLAERADEQYEKEIALKLIKRGMDTDFILRRFRTERQVLANLDHPNIARLLDGGSTEDGLPYLVMEHIEGQPIDVYCDERGLPLAERLKLFRTVCAAVQYAHQSLVVHRDLKPGNILVTADGVPKLLDFGIAKILNPASGPQTESLVALRLMTPEYASPEQIRGEKITTASDIYSLGVLLYELLTGHRPYRFEGRLPEEIARAVAGSEPLKPSDSIAGRGLRTGELKGTPHQLAVHNPHALKGDLDNIVLMALRKEPQRRYNSVEQFSEDIRRHLAGLPVIARRDTFGYRAGKFLRRHKAAAGAGALVLLALVAGIIATTRQARIARAQQALAEAERAHAQKRFDDVRRLAHSLIFELHDAIKDLPGSTQARELLVKRALEYLDSLAQEAGSDPALQRELASAYEKLGNVQGEPFRSNLGDSAGALESYRKALLIREAVAQADPRNADVRRELANGYRNFGFKLWDLNDSTGALDYNRKALALYRELVAEESANTDDRYDLAREYVYVGMILLDQGETAAALESHRQGQQIYEALLAGDPAEVKARVGVSMVDEKIGNVMLLTGDGAGSLEMNRKALGLRAALSAGDPEDTYYRRILEVSYEKIGDAQAELGETLDALASYHQELAICQKLADEDPANAQLRSELSSPHVKIGDMLAKLGDTRGALTHQRRALALRQELAAADPASLGKRWDLLESYCKTANALARAGEAGASLANCREAEALLDATRDDPANASLLVYRASDDALIGETYSLLAAKGTTSFGEPSKLRAAACLWYQRSLDLWQDLRGRGKLSRRDAAKSDEVSRQAAKCKGAVGR